MGRRCVCVCTQPGAQDPENPLQLCVIHRGLGKRQGSYNGFHQKIRPSWIRGTGQICRFGLCPVNPPVRGMLGTWTKQNEPFAYGSIDQGNADTREETPGLFCHGFIGQGNVGTCIARPGQSAHSSIKQGAVGISDLTKQGCLQLCK